MRRRATAVLLGALLLGVACAGSRRASAPAPFSRLVAVWQEWDAQGQPFYDVLLHLPWAELQELEKEDPQIRLVATATVSELSGKVRQNKTWSKQVPRREAKTAGDFEWSLRLQTDPGEQQLALAVLVQGQAFGSPWRRSFIVPAVRSDALFLGEPVFLVPGAAREDSGSADGRVLVGRTYDANAGSLQFRTAIYDFLPAAPSATFRLSIELENLDRRDPEPMEEPWRHSERDVVRRGAITPVEAELPTLPLGRYRLQLQVEDGSRNAWSEGWFEVGLTALADLSAGGGGAELYRLLLGSEEADSLLAAPPEARQTLWDRFWRQRDPDPSTPENEARDTMLQRLRHANDFFGESRSGWRTDRGRVYLLYGPPDHVDRLSNSEGFDRIERWSYDAKRLVFVFIDPDGRGEYTLLRTNAAEF